jgi:hypothetical protein
MRRRLPAALLTGAGIFLGVAAMFGGIAGARGPAVWFPQSDAPQASPAPIVDSAPAIETRVREKSPRHSAAKSFVAGDSVCVRLCDGFFFPNVILSGGDAACAAQCPDAPTALYTRPAGSDDIGMAISLRGAPYSALPVANRQQTTFDETCTCHLPGKRSYVTELLHDSTLRSGDLVMTASGVMVFEGGKSGPIAPKDFVALGRASNVAKDWRAALTAMEHAGAWDHETSERCSSTTLP